MAGLWIKICGITRASDAELAADLGASAIGLNFYAKSPRHIPPAAVPPVLTALPPTIEPIGLFADTPVPIVCETLKTIPTIKTVQWHGNRGDLGARLPFRVIPAFPIETPHDVEVMVQYLDECKGHGWQPAAVLVDARVPGLHGGTGKTAPWGMLANLQLCVPLILAGGLTPENVGDAIRIVRPQGVDVAGGVERSPGHKDPEKLRRFVDQAREAAQRRKA